MSWSWVTTKPSRISFRFRSPTPVFERSLEETGGNLHPNKWAQTCEGFNWEVLRKWVQIETIDTTNGPNTFLSWRPMWHRLNPNPGTGRLRTLRLLLHLASDGQSASTSARAILYRTTSRLPSATRRLLPTASCGRRLPFGTPSPPPAKWCVRSRRRSSFCALDFSLFQSLLGIYFQHCFVDLGWHVLMFL